MCRKVWVWCCLLAVVMCGCARQPDPFGRQVSRGTEAGLRGQELLSEGEHRQAERALTKSLRINRSIDNPMGSARQLNNLAALALTRGDLPEAKNLFQQALFVNQGIGNDADAAINLANLATIAQKDGDLPKAERYLEEARNLARLSGSARVRGQVLCQMAGLALDRQDPGTAAVLLEEAQPAAQLAEVQGAWNYQQGRLSLAGGDTVKALAFFQAALAADRSILNRPGMGADLQGLGQVWEAQGDFSRAFLYYSRAFDLYAATGSLEKAQLCLDVLRRLNKAGRLGHSLKPYEQQLAVSKAAAAPCPPPAKTTPPTQEPARPEEL
jgi:tetratricopeptide (TPR) repeat protein